MHEMRRGCVEVPQWSIRTVKILSPNGRVVAKSSFPIATRKCKSGGVRDCPPGVAEAHQHRHPLWQDQDLERSGEKPSGVDQLTMAARVQDPGAIVWRGNHEIPASEQGMKVLARLWVGTSTQPGFWRRSQNSMTFCMVQDVQASWLLLSFCAATRANFYL